MIYFNELSNIDIEKIIKIFNLSDAFDGVYSKDKLPKLKKGKLYIINMKNSTDGVGHTGWHYSIIFHYIVFILTVMDMFH